MADNFNMKKLVNKKKRTLENIPQEDLAIGSGADLSDLYDKNINKESKSAPTYDFLGRSENKSTQTYVPGSGSIDFGDNEQPMNTSSIPGKRYKHVPDSVGTKVKVKSVKPTESVKNKDSSIVKKKRAKTGIETTGTGRDDGLVLKKNSKTNMIRPGGYDAVDPHPKGKMPVAKPYKGYDAVDPHPKGKMPTEKPYKGYEAVDPHPVRKKAKPYKGYDAVDPHPVRKKATKVDPAPTSIRDEAITNLAKKKKPVVTSKATITSKPVAKKKVVKSIKPKAKTIRSAPVKKKEKKVQMVNTTSGNPFAKNFGGWGQLLQKDKTTKSGSPITRSEYNKKLLATGDKGLTSKVAEAARAKVRKAKSKSKPSSRKKRKGLGMDSALDLF